MVYGLQFCRKKMSFLRWVTTTTTVIFLFCTIFIVKSKGQQMEIVEKLEKMNVTQGKITMTGFSSGATMTMQVGMAFSKNIGAIATFSPIWYRCAPKDEIFYRLICSNNLYPVENGVDDAKKFAQQGLIDDLTNLVNNSVYIWIGEKDELAKAETRRKAVTFYEAVGVPSKNIFLLVNQTAYHFMPTINTSNPTCEKAHSFEAIVNSKLTGVAYCRYDGAFEALNFVMGGHLTRPNRNVPIPLEPLRLFNQSTFLAQKDQKYMDTTGFLYVPSGCKNATCPFHISLHGCLGSRSNVQDQFVRQSGYLEVAEVNGIIILFPQSISFFGNNQGCWEVWRMIGDNYANKQGVQVSAIGKMIDVVTGRSLF